MAMIDVEIVYANEQKQRLLSLKLPMDSTVMSAIQQSMIVDEFPEIDLSSVSVGIFSHAVSNPESHLLQHGDRIEIYRPLKIDPKQARTLRALNSK